MTKEGARAIWINLMFKKVPERIVIEMILFVVLWLNEFPPIGGISQTCFPRTITEDCNLDYFKHFRLEFGTYEETHEDVTPTKNMSGILQGDIYLGTTKNFQVSYKLSSLRTGRRIIGKQFTPLTMTQFVINQVEDMVIN